ncbi:MAG: cytochrome c biogenesis protein ResB [Planctomycetes bacterium]|nr:cytochrome c biogenesis protein ResB [Planctomycetota bacterium]
MSAQQDKAKATDGRQLSGGMIRPEKGHMPTLFSLILFWWLATMAITVALPYLLYRHSDQEPSGGKIIFWSVLCLGSTLNGALAYWTFYNKGARARDFVIGALLLPFAFPLLSIMHRGSPDGPPEQPRGLVRWLDRVAYLLGDLKFGIAQLALLLLFLLRATIYENQFSDKGNEAAYASYYNNPLMGLLFALFFATIYCATMRKYPFRWHQAGWLMVHAGLLALMIGCMMMYWGTVSAYTFLYEGQTVARAYSNDVRELVVSIPSLGLQETHRISVDFDPAEEEVEQLIPIRSELNGRVEEFELRIDRSLAKAEFFEGLIPSDDQRDGPGIRVRITAPGSEEEKVMLANGSSGTLELGSLQLMVQGLRDESFIDSIGNAYAATDRTRGRLRVRREGKQIAEIPILLGDQAGDDLGQGRIVASTATTVDGLRIKAERYFDLIQLDADGRPMDANPGQANSPGLALRIDGDQGSALVNVASRLSRPLPGDNVYGLDFDYEVLHEIPINVGQVLIAITQRDGWVVVMGTSDGLRHERLAIGQPYAFSDRAPIRFTVLEALERARFDEGLRTSKSRNTFRALHGTISAGGTKESFWVVHGNSVPKSVRIGARVINLEYRSRRIEMPFSLSLLDFRQFEYANSGKPKKFETNLVLRDPKAGVEEAVLIDMNHPLGWGGYRFFNGSPILDDKTARRGVVLTVGANPGYPVIIMASLLIFVGIIVVFFFKGRIRNWDTRRRQAALAARS